MTVALLRILAVLLGTAGLLCLFTGLYLVCVGHPRLPPPGWALLGCFLLVMGYGLEHSLEGR